MPTAIESKNYLAQNSLNKYYPDDVSRVLDKLAERDYSQNTQKAVLRDLGAFFSWYQQKNGEAFSFGRLVERDAIDFRDDARKAELAVSTVNRRLVSLRIFCDVAVDLEIIAKNPAKHVRQLALQKLAPKGLTDQDLRKVLKEVEIRENLRDRLLFELMTGAGLRVSEVANLRVQDVQISERKGTATIKNSKGNKTREVPLNQKIRLLFAEYLEKEEPQNKIFRGQRGEITTLAVNKIVEKYGRKAGVKLSPHSLRHTFAFNYLRANPLDLVGLSQILGHSNINTTAIYTQNRLKDLQERVEGLNY